MIDAVAVALLLTLLEDAEGLHEAFGELYAEYRGEIARYGDAWPGSAAQVAAGHAALDEVDRVAALVRAIEPPYGCHVPAPVYDPDDLPF